MSDQNRTDSDTTVYKGGSVAVAPNEHQVQCVDHEYLALLDGLDAAVYVSDIDTYEVLFVNKAAQDVFGAEMLGDKCWRVFQEGQTGPCSFCTNPKLLDKKGEPTKGTVWEFERKSSGHQFKISDRAIRWRDGRLVRLAILTNITDMKIKELELVRRVQELTAIGDFTAEITSNLSVGEVVDSALKGIMSIVEPDLVLFFRRDGSDLHVMKQLAMREGLTHVVEAPHKVGQCLCGLAVSLDMPIYSSNLAEDARCTWFECKRAGLTTFAALPVRHDGEAFGVLAMASENPDQDFQSQSEFVEALANALAVGVRNASLHEDNLSKQEKIQQAHVKTASLFRAAPVGIGLVFDRVMHEVNDRLCEMSGYGREELLGQSARIFYESDEEFDLVGREGIGGLYRNGISTIETVWVRKDGSSIDVRLSFSPLDPNDFSKGLTSTAQDITHEKQALEALVYSEEKYRRLIENTGTAFVIVDTDGVVLDANPKYVELSGHQDLDAILGRNVLEWTAPEQRESNLEGIKQSLADGGIRDLLVEYERADGTRRILEVNAAVVLGSKGIELHSLCRDITKQKRSQEALIQAQKMLSVGGLAAGMAHEINNPLGGILQGVQNIQRRTSPDFRQNTPFAEKHDTSMDAIHGYLEDRGINRTMGNIQEAAMRAAAIVRNMLGFSRKSEKRLERCELPMMLDTIVELASTDYNLKKEYDFRKISILREYDPAVPFVVCDSNEIQQVILNLLRNGAQAMAEKEYDGETPQFVLRVSREDDMAVVEVEDNGMGMEEEVRRRIFEPFFTTKEVGKGTGLGLSVSYFIVSEQHGGHMEVASVPGKGTTFTIKLPLGASEDD